MEIRAISSIVPVLIVVVIVAVAGTVAYFVLNNQTTASTTNMTTCSLNICRTNSTSSLTSTSVTTYSTTYSVTSTNSGGNCSLSNAVAFTSYPLKVLSVGVNCSTSIFEGSSYNTNNRSVFNFNMTIENTGNQTIYIGALFGTPLLSYVTFGTNNGLIQQQSNQALCTVISNLIPVAPNGIVSALDPSCLSEYFNYATTSGSVPVTLTLASWNRNGNYEPGSTASVNATLTIS